MGDYRKGFIAGYKEAKEEELDFLKVQLKLLTKINALQALYNIENRIKQLEKEKQDDTK